jgi:hypothetical protein
MSHTKLRGMGSLHIKRHTIRTVATADSSTTTTGPRQPLRRARSNTAVPPPPCSNAGCPVATPVNRSTKVRPLIGATLAAHRCNPSPIVARLDAAGSKDGPRWLQPTATMVAPLPHKSSIPVVPPPRWGGGDEASRAQERQSSTGGAQRGRGQGRGGWRRGGRGSMAATGRPARLESFSMELFEEGR